jgi:hypothetical protein
LGDRDFLSQRHQPWCWPHTIHFAFRIWKHHITRSLVMALNTYIRRHFCLCRPFLLFSFLFCFLILPFFIFRSSLSLVLPFQLSHSYVAFTSFFDFIFLFPFLFVLLYIFLLFSLHMSLTSLFCFGFEPRTKYINAVSL